MRPKSMFPASNPQQASDLTRPEKPGDGFALQDWSGPPVNASHLVFGYGAVVNGVFVVYGNLYDVRQATQIRMRCSGDYRIIRMKPARPAPRTHKFAADIIQRVRRNQHAAERRLLIHGAPGGFRSEIWVMDWDGKNQKQLTHLGAQIVYPAISADGSRLAFTYWPATGDPRPRIGMVTSIEPNDSVLQPGNVIQMRRHSRRMASECSIHVR